jgi:hypothetical protein
MYPCSYPLCTRQCALRSLVGRSLYHWTSCGFRDGVIIRIGFVVCVFACACVFMMYACMFVCVCICIYVYMYICVCMYVCMYSCMYVYIYIYTYIHTYIYSATVSLDSCDSEATVYNTAEHASPLRIKSCTYKKAARNQTAR